MEGTDHEKIITVLKENYGEEILHIEAPYNFLTVTLKKDRIIEIIRIPLRPSGYKISIPHYTWRHTLP